jgi:6-pyruvoyltetrahydropterin/6-carboxytetrahydropterin synthase
MQLITRKTEFDASHRVMNEKMKCYNQHGHRYTTYITFSFENMEDIGYAIDFKEIKRVGMQWIDDILDHGAIYNPQDFDFIEPCKKHHTKLWLMSLHGENNYCNPTVENISKEIFLAMEVLFKEYKLLKIHEVVIYETPNCYVNCKYESITKMERENWMNKNYEQVRRYAEDKGIVEYDDRKCI